MPLPSIRRAARRLLSGRDLPAIVRSVRADGLTYLDEDALSDLYELVQALEARQTPGTLIEAGCALGGSAIVLAAAKSPTRPLLIYDVFGMIPPPSEADGDDVRARYAEIESGRSMGLAGHRYYGYEEDLLGVVQRNFHQHGVGAAANSVEFIQGLFADTLHPAAPVALAHIDGDWYESVITCLERIVPCLIRGGVLVIDDYDHWSGCKRAVDTYFDDKRDHFEFIRRSRLHVVRKDVD